MKRSIGTHTKASNIKMDKFIKNWNEVNEKTFDLYKSIIKMADEFLVNDEIPEKWTSKYNCIENLITDISSNLSYVNYIISIHNGINYHLKNRLYVLSRDIKDKDEPLTWKELNSINSDGPWRCDISQMEYARSERDRRNLTKSSTTRYKITKVWQIWSYSVKENEWKLEE